MKKPGLMFLLSLLSEEQSLQPPNDRLTELIAAADADSDMSDDELELVFAARKAEMKREKLNHKEK